MVCGEEISNVTKKTTQERGDVCSTGKEVVGTSSYAGHAVLLKIRCSLQNAATTGIEEYKKNEEQIYQHDLFCVVILRVD